MLLEIWIRNFNTARMLVLKNVDVDLILLNLQLPKDFSIWQHPDILNVDNSASNDGMEK